jgi:protein-S-isoprenylcysteine O-methyltransferase Ste14
MPRWLTWIVWVFFFPGIYVAIPYCLSLSSTRHGWQGGHPTLLNFLGLVGVTKGVAIFGWVMREHVRNIPKEGARLGNPFRGPGYVLTRGPYALCRHPMHVGTLSIWFGWGLFYGSSGVLIGAALILLAVVALVPAEERGMEAQLGEQYRRYMAKVPRWGFGRRRISN